MSCCNTGLGDVFTEASSRKDAERYRRKGLPARSRKLLAAIGSPKNRTTLEIGTGAGGLTVEMLRRGATHATGVDAVAAQLAAAQMLAAEFEVVDRVNFVEGDFTERDVANADIVVLDRVVCCYPDWRVLLASAASHTNQTLALTYPRDVWFMRLISRGMALFWRLRRSAFRFHVHPAHEMQAFLAANGLKPNAPTRHFGWEVLIAERARA